MRTVIIGLIQQTNVESVQENMQKLRRNIENVTRQGAQLVVLQELHNSLYFEPQMPNRI